LHLLRGYHWPGNVRQLRSVVRRAGLITSGKVTAANIQACMPSRPTQISVPARPTVPPDAVLRDLVHERVRQVERDAILGALGQAAGNQAAAARQLGIDYKTFRVKLKSFKQEASVSHALAAP
jgi:two-component system nitrogen regulation response regulator GlnG